MLFQTPTQFAILALCLIAGWLFGLASAPGGRKWKDRLRETEVDHARYREETERTAKEKDRHIRDLEKDRDDRIRTLEKERDAAIKAGGATAAGTAATQDTAGSSSRRGWFGWGRDNLSRIRGIDEAEEQQLHAEGIKTYAAIQGLSDADAAALEEKLSMGSGRIAKQQWREQAALLADGREDDHARDFA